MPDSFVHLHQHTEYSMLDGAARIGDVVASAVADGQPAMGITDHGNMYGVLPFYKECRAQGIKPIIGTEAYMAHDARSERPPRRGRVDDSGGEVEGGKKLYYHLTLLAETNVGYKNLIQLASRAYMEGYYYKPRCLLPGQEIMTDRGPVPIDDIRVGDLVLTHRGRLRRVTQTMTREHDGPIFGVELNNRYRRVTWMTGEHPVLVRHRDGSRSWVEVQDLEAGRANTRQELSAWRSFVCLPKLRPDEEVTSIATADHVGGGWEPTGDGRFVKETMRSARGATRHYSELLGEVELDYDFGFFLGLYAAEGHSDRHRRVCFSLHRDETELIGRVDAMARVLVGKGAVVQGRPDRPDYKGVLVAIDSAPLARMMTALCGVGANHKSLPSFLHSAPAKFRKGLLDGVLAGDGADHGNTVILTQTSRTLAWQVRLLAAEVHGSFSCPVTAWDGDGSHAPQYRLNVSIPGEERHRRTLEDDEYAYRPVAAVHTQHYQGPVFNIEVEDDHSYVSDFAIHNCDWDLLEQHHEGVIATTGCLGGHVLQSLMNQGFDAALEKAARLQDIFGRDNLFVEIQDHGIPEQRRTNPQLLEIAKRLQAPLIATNDSHYVQRGDAVAHDALLCVQTGSLMSDPDRFKFSGDHHYLKTSGEMRRLFDEVASACDNSLWIAERCDVEIEFGKPQLPNFPLPEGFADDAAYLEHLTFEGARARWGDELPDDAVERLAYELKVIGDMGFCSYFLITWDLIKHARDANIRVGPGRGSAAGCAVAYCLRITDLDPIRYDLLFERFLNPSRISMPDIDMDFDSRYRDEMIRYAAERYGRDHVAQIVTFSTIKARAAVRDAARVLGQPYATGDRIAKAMPPLIMGRDTPLYACLEPHPKFEDGYKMAAELREMYNADADTKQVIDVAKGLEGLRRQDGIHAAAVVITKEPLTEYLPIQRKPESGQAPEDAPVVTQYEMGGVEELGLLKMDFLGLRNLDVISDTLELIQETRGIEVDIDNVPLDDPPTYELLRRADTIGVFQLEGGPMRALIKSLAPTEFEDVAALVALYRPGPMAANMHTDYADRKNGRQEVTYLHPDAEEILGDTYGLCLTGDTIVFDAVTGRPTRLDEVDPGGDFWVQAVDDDLEPVLRRVTHWFDNGERDTVALRLANGMALSGTPDHPVLAERGWVGLLELREDDYVATAPRLLRPLTPATASRSRLRLLGYLLGDGSLSTRSAVAFVNSDTVLLDEFEAIVADAFPTTRPSRFTGPNGVTKVTVGNGKGNGGGASPLLEWLRGLGLKAPPGEVKGGPLSHEKSVPEVVFRADDDGVARFLAALWDCDGYVGERMAHYRTVSPQLARQVQLLLLRLGIRSTVTTADYIVPGSGASRTAHQVSVFDGVTFGIHIGVHLAARHKRDALFIAESRGATLPRAEVVASIRQNLTTSVRAYADANGVPRWHFSPYASAQHPRVHVNTLAAVIDDLGLHEWQRASRVDWVRVAAVEPAGVQRVYDITVDEVHNFVANGIVAHNCIYQEGIMRVAQRFAGYSLAEADNLRKAMGKKNKELIAKERVKFTDGCEQTGYGAELGGKWMDIIEPFADYAFNRSHSYGYGYVAYQTAFLKANYPAEYLSALLTSVKQSLEKAAIYLAECRTMGIEVKVPDVNRSASDFTPDLSDPEVQRIVFGLSAVRNVGEGLVELIVAEREAEGPFVDFYDFCERVNTGVLNKRTVESLIKAGAFDSMGHPRKGLLQAFEQIVDQTVARRKEHDMGVQSLFGALDDGPSFDERIQIAAVEFDKKERLAHEKEMLGLYVSDHPLLGAERMLRRKSECTVGELAELDDGTRRTVGGVITGLNKKWTKRGDLMAVFTLEDLQGSIEVMVFPKTMAAIGHLLADDAVVLLGARVDKRDDTAKLIASDIELFEPMADGVPPLRLHLRPGQLDDDTVRRIKELFADFPGEAEVHILLGDTQVLRLPDEFLVSTQGGLVGELRALLGIDAVVI